MTNYGLAHNESAQALALAVMDSRPPVDLAPSLRARDILLDQLGQRLGHTLQGFWAPPAHAVDASPTYVTEAHQLFRSLSSHPRLGDDDSPTDLFSHHPDHNLVRAARGALLATDHLTNHPRPLNGNAQWQVVADVAESTMALTTIDTSLARHPDADDRIRETLTGPAEHLYVTAQMARSLAISGPLDPTVDQAQRRDRARPTVTVVNNTESALEAAQNIGMMLGAYPIINEPDLRTVLRGQGEINHVLGRLEDPTSAHRPRFEHRSNLLRRTSGEMRRVASLPSLPNGHPALAQTAELLRHVRNSRDPDLPTRLDGALATTAKATGHSLAAGLHDKRLLTRDHDSIRASWRPVDPSLEEPAISSYARALRAVTTRNDTGVSTPPPPARQPGRTALTEQIHQRRPPLRRPHSPRDKSTGYGR